MLSKKRLHRKIIEAQVPGACAHQIPTGDPNMPPHICKAKHIYYKIVLATDGSTGGLEDDGGDLDNERDGEFKEDEEDDEEEGGMVKVNNNSFSFSADEEQLTMDGEVGSRN